MSLRRWVVIGVVGTALAVLSGVVTARAMRSDSQSAAKLDQPLPFTEHERVVITVRAKQSRIRRSQGLLRWTGDPEILRRIAEDPDLSVAEST